MAQGQKSSKVLGWISLVLLVVGGAAFVIPVLLFSIALGADGVKIGDSPVTVPTSAGKTWGIYNKDADNTGYSQSCSVSDGRGAPIAIRNPGPTISSSDTEMLDQVFTTPRDGAFTIECSTTSATVRIGPVGNFVSVLMGIAGAMVLGLTGFVLGVVWLGRRLSTPTPMKQLA